MVAEASSFVGDAEGAMTTSSSKKVTIVCSASLRQG